VNDLSLAAGKGSDYFRRVQLIAVLCFVTSFDFAFVLWEKVGLSDRLVKLINNVLKLVSFYIY